MNTLVGTGVALVTPFKNDLSVDHDALSNIVKYNIDNGTNYLVISGTTGESVTISKQEKQEIILTIKKTNAGRLPLVLGIGGNNTAKVIDEINNTNLSDLPQYSQWHLIIASQPKKVFTSILKLFLRLVQFQL